MYSSTEKMLLLLVSKELSVTAKAHCPFRGTGMLYSVAALFLSFSLHKQWAGKSNGEKCRKNIDFSTSKTKYKSDMIQLDIIKERSV